MSQKDQLKWDKKYTDNPRLLESREASIIVQRFSKLAWPHLVLHPSMHSRPNSVET